MPSRIHVTHTVGLKIRRHLGMLVWVGESDREEGWKTRVEREIVLQKILQRYHGIVMGSDAISVIISRESLTR